MITCPQNVRSEFSKLVSTKKKVKCSSQTRSAQCLCKGPSINYVLTQGEVGRGGGASDRYISIAYYICTEKREGGRSPDNM